MEAKVDRITEIEREIAHLKEEYDQVTGTETEIYTRIVGYYRSLRNWNTGKREEFSIRKTFDHAVAAQIAEASHQPGIDRSETSRNRQNGADDVFTSAVRYELFTRPGCPNCPAMKKAVTDVPFDGSEVYVDTEEGLARAAELQIYATPTVVFFDDNDRPVGRCTDPAELPVAHGVTDL